MMKKSTFGAVLAFLFVAAGALTAAALYLYRREKELDEYERLLFNEDEYEDEYNEDYSCDGGYEWTEEDSWDALTDGMYGDMPSNPMEYDAMMDAMGF